MNFSIDARGINLYKGSGIGTYIENLTLELLNIDKKNNYTIFWAGDNFQKYKRKNSKVILTSKKHNLFFEIITILAYYKNIILTYTIYHKMVWVYQTPITLLPSSLFMI